MISKKNQVQKVITEKAEDMIVKTEIARNEYRTMKNRKKTKMCQGKKTMIMMVTRIEIMISSTVATKKIAIMIGFVIQLLLQKARKRTLHLEIRKVVILRIKMLKNAVEIVTI